MRVKTVLARLFSLRLAGSEATMSDSFPCGATNLAVASGDARLADRVSVPGTGAMPRGAEEGMVSVVVALHRGGHAQHALRRMPPPPKPHVTRAASHVGALMADLVSELNGLLVDGGFS